MIFDGILVRVRRAMHIACGIQAAIVLPLLLTACNEVSNNPHPLGSEKTNTMFVPFTSRSPKYLDPTSSYSNDETPYTYQVYEPPYGYHYLKRPYTLVGRAAQEVASPRYMDHAGRQLPDNAPGEQIAETIFAYIVLASSLFDIPSCKKLTRRFPSDYQLIFSLPRSKTRGRADDK